jgi:nucleotide-binding universal stress UspA family protein
MLPNCSNHYLFLCDFSEAAKHAFSYLMQMVHPSEDFIYVLNVQNFPLGDSVMLTNFSRQSPIMIESAIHRLEDLVKPYLSTHNLSYGAEFGQVSISVEEYCEKNKVDAVVMGSKRKSDFLVNIFGSNTFELIHGAAFPLLLIPVNIPFKEALKIGYASDLRLDEEPYFLKIKKLFRNRIASFHWVHISEKSNEYSENRAKEMLSSSEGLFENSTAEIYIHEALSEALDDFVVHHSLDVMVFRKQFRTLLDRIVQPSITRNFTFRSNIPLLILPE